jgi:TatD DNase family protein
MKTMPSHLQALEKLARHPRVLAWGEIGLDYHYDFSPPEDQARLFQEQLALARAAKLPVVIHCREAWPDCLDLLEKQWRSSGLGGILHCFSGSLADGRRGMDMGFLVSFAGNCTYPKAQNLRDVAREVPLDRLLMETDVPYLAPQSRRGKRNEPALVAEVAQTLAVVRNLPVEELAAATAENFRRLLRINRTDGPRMGPGSGSSAAAE